MRIASLLNLGAPDLVIIIGIVLLLYGAKKLPELARRMGEAIRQSHEGRGFFDLSDVELFVVAAIIALTLIAANWLINPHL